MKKTMLCLLLAAALSPLSGSCRHPDPSHRRENPEHANDAPRLCPEERPQYDRSRRPDSPVHPQRPSCGPDLRYRIVGQIVIFGNRKVEGVSAKHFKDLGAGYGVDSWSVFYRGRKVSDASPASFQVLEDGYAQDRFSIFYRGRKLKNASTARFRVLGDGYAADTWRVYFCGREVADAAVSSFRVLGDGYAEDAWNAYRFGRRIR